MRLPVAVPPARHETVASYLARLGSLHGLARASCGTRSAARNLEPAGASSIPAGWP